MGTGVGVRALYAAALCPSRIDVYGISLAHASRFLAGQWYSGRRPGRPPVGGMNHSQKMPSVQTETMEDGCRRDVLEWKLTRKATIRSVAVIPDIEMTQRPDHLVRVLGNTAIEILSEVGVADPALFF